MIIKNKGSGYPIKEQIEILALFMWFLIEPGIECHNKDSFTVLSGFVRVKKENSSKLQHY